MQSGNSDEMYRMPSSPSLIEQNIKTCIKKILEARDSKTISSDFFSQYIELVSLLSPEERADEQNNTVLNVIGYLEKRREGIDWGSITSLVIYHLFRNYTKRLIRKITGVYGIAGPEVLRYYTFVSKLYATLRNREPIQWLDGIKEAREVFRVRWKEMREEEDDLLFVLSVVSARVLYYLSYGNEGRNEVNMLASRILKEIEEKERGEEGRGDELKA
jgi:hypothetical protein